MNARQEASVGPSGLWRRWHRRRPGATLPQAETRTIFSGLTETIRAAIERRRLFILLPFGVIAGLVVYWSLPIEPTAPTYAVGSLTVAVALAISLIRASLPATRWSVQACAAWIGFILLPLHGVAFGTTMLTYPTYGSYSAVVDEVLAGDGVAQRAIISRLVAIGDSRPVDVRRVRLLLPAGVRVQPGDQVQAALRLAPIPGPVLPGSHDGQFHSYFIGIGAYGSVTGDLVLSSQEGEANIPRSIQALRDAISDRIGAVLDHETAAIAKAMVVGDQSAITDQTREVMAAAGLAHIYSISGLHLSIVAGGIFWLLRLALASFPALVIWPTKEIAAVAGIIAAFLYLLLAGGIDNVPAFRSTLMLALIFGAVLAGRQALTMRNVAIAALLIVVIDPASVFRPSFQLSFAAVVGLIGVFELPRRQSKGAPGAIRRIGSVITATAWTSLVAGLATLLFSAYHFQQTAPLGVAGNVLALPFVSLVIMPFGVVSVLTMPFGADAPFLVAMGWGIDRMVDIAEMVATWSAGWTGNPLLAGWTLVVGLAALAWFAFLHTHWRLVGPLVAVALVVGFGLERRPDILIADTTQAVAIRDGAAMALASGRTGSFAVEVWSDHFQTDIGPSHSEARCDGLGCVVVTPDYTVAIVRNAAAFAEDCGLHDLVITRIRPPSYCAQGGQVIGPANLASGGVHALFWDAATHSFDIHPAIAALDRPWRIKQQ